MPSGKSRGNATATVEYAHAAPVPSATSVSMSAVLFRKERHAPVKKRPPTNVRIGIVSSPLSAQRARRDPGAMVPTHSRRPGSISAWPIKSTGKPRAAPTLKRRNLSATSAARSRSRFSSASAIVSPSGIRTTV